MRSVILSLAVGQVCLFAGLFMVFVPETPRPGLGWTLFGLGIVLELATMPRLVAAMRAREAASRLEAPED
ncbi:MAG: hypothetical protein AAF321_06050 [Pseudomonadota bacterium]